jgi:hypothetical protein
MINPKEAEICELSVTPAQVQQMPGLRSRWETESFLKRAEAFHDYTADDLERDIAAIRDASRRFSKFRSWRETEHSHRKKP